MRYGFELSGRWCRERVRVEIDAQTQTHIDRSSLFSYLHSTVVERRRSQRAKKGRTSTQKPLSIVLTHPIYPNVLFHRDHTSADSGGQQFFYTHITAMNNTKNTLVKSSIPGQSQNDDFQTDIATCTHGFDVLSIVGIRKDFISAFEIAFNNAADDDGAAGGIWSSIVEAKNATSEDYAEVWKDVSMMKWVISYMLYHGTRCVLDDNVDFARDLAAVTRYFEQCIAVELNKTKAIIDWTAIDELYEADEHTLVKFFRKGIRCSCLDEKYKEVKCIPKMGRCYNVECTLPDGRVERSKMMCCSRCRQMTYCSRECQQASWANHKKFCNNYLAIKAEFDAKKAQKKPTARGSVYDGFLGGIKRTALHVRTYVI